MNLHEYQGKEILASFGVATQKGIVAQNTDEAVAAAAQLTKDTGTSWHVVKAQIHAGGRGKGGGVKLAKSLEEVKTFSRDIYSITHIFIGINYTLRHTVTTNNTSKNIYQNCRYFRIF